MEGSTANELSVKKIVSVLQGHSGDVNCAVWSPTSVGTLCTGSGDKTIRVWNITDATSTDKSEQPKKIVAAHKFYVNSCAYNPSGSLVATTSSDDTVKIWSTVSWTCAG